MAALAQQRQWQLYGDLACLFMVAGLLSHILCNLEEQINSTLFMPILDSIEICNQKKTLNIHIEYFFPKIETTHSDLTHTG